MKVIARMMVRGLGSSLRRKNAYPILGRPMIWWTLTEAKRAKFIDEIFVWTEDEELSKISRECGCHVIPRTRDQLFYNDGLSDISTWSDVQNGYIISKCGELEDVKVALNCNLCLMTAEILEKMFHELMADDSATQIFPITKLTSDFFIDNPKTNCLFPILSNPHLKGNSTLNLYRLGGTSISRFGRGKSGLQKKFIYLEVPPEYVLDVHSEEDVKLAEYYLMKRLGGEVLLPDLNSAKEDELKPMDSDAILIHQYSAYGN